MPALRRRGRFHPLRVSAVRELTADAVEVTFAVPPELQGEYAYLPGQHIALRAHVDGQELRRSYSLCRPPAPGSLSVAIKRDRGGRFSTWAREGLRAGDTIDVMSPQGAFVTSLPDLEGVHIAAIAAGSGITPVLALAQAVLTGSASSRVTLVYANRSSTDVMFVDELADLKDRAPARFALHHVLSRERRTAPVLSGRLDDERLATIIDDLIAPTGVDEWFLCGPLELVERCRRLLVERDVDPARIRHELFTTGTARGDAPARRPVETGEESYTLELTLDGQTSTVVSPRAAHESLLTAALRVRPDAPFACAGGVCGTCRARVVEGDVAMSENYALEAEELARGYVLTCQSHPTGDRVRVDYDA